MKRIKIVSKREKAAARKCNGLFLSESSADDVKPHRHCFAMPPVRVAAPSVHFVQSTRVLLAAAPTTPPCFRRWRRSSLLPNRGGLGKEGKLYAMPRAPLLAGAVTVGDWGVNPLRQDKKPAPSSPPPGPCRSSSG